MQNIVIERIIKIKKNENLTNETFAEQTNLSVDTIKSMFSKKTNPSLETIQKIYSAFPHYNLEWIIIGRGNMLKENKQDNISIAADSVPKYGSNTNKKYVNMDYKEKYYEQLEIVNELRERIDDFQKEKLEVKNEPTGAGDVVTPAKVG